MKLRQIDKLLFNIIEKNYQLDLIDFLATSRWCFQEFFLLLKVFFLSRSERNPF